MSQYLFAPFRHSDLKDIAALHALSWQRHYRGILPDDYLDQKAPAERLEVWTERFTKENPLLHVITLKKDDQLVGFSGVFLDHDLTFGAYIDNLHVLSEHQGHGLGRQLMVETAQWVHAQRSNSPIYLYVFDENREAIAFYERIGGKHELTKPVKSPGGVEPPVRLYSWMDIQVLLKL